ncbi:MAG: flavin reductase family protein, partial [Anaerolineales bacterium]
MMETMMALDGEKLRYVMRHWTTGVSIVTSCYDDIQHGMTVNSFTSISLEPPRVVVTMANTTRTHALVQKSEIFAVTILGQHQIELAERFAGHVPESENRLAGLATKTLVSGAPLLRDGLAHIDCRVIHSYPMQNSTLFIGEVLAAEVCQD